MKLKLAQLKQPFFNGKYSNTLKPPNRLVCCCILRDDNRKYLKSLYFHNEAIMFL